MLKWSRALQAAFERANRTAGKKCVRGVVGENKLLTDNPWKQFTWIEGTNRPIRQFDGEELLSFLDYLEQHWEGLTVAVVVAKVFLWSQARRTEVANLRWSHLKSYGNEHHFEIVGKWGVDKWFRLPESLYSDLLSERTDSDFVFEKHTAQLRQFYSNSRKLRQVGESFNPVNLGDWFHSRLVEWCKQSGNDHATPHVFRKTSLQYARAGEDLARRVASDARVSESVMMTNYVRETDELRQQQSNRIFARIVASLPLEVATRYGHVQSEAGMLEAQLREATDAKDWNRVSILSEQLERHQVLDGFREAPG